nr:FtsK/SpoIIIE domain-containing protein [uncultured Lachnoclostridium sp.]
MGKLTESYNDIISRVKSINDRIKLIESEIQRKLADTASDNTARIIKLEEQLAKIDDYLLRVKGFQELAKKNLDSQNVLTIEAPPGYRVNINRLSDWSKMIDPMSSNDPYAQRVFAVAKCDEYFLEQKKKEFSERIEELKSNSGSEKNDEIERLNRSLALAREELRQFAMSTEIKEFSQMVVRENEKYWSETSPTSFVNRDDFDDVFSPGAYAAPLNFAKEQRTWLKSLMGDYYDINSGRVLLPVEISNKQEYIMSITCAPAKRKSLDRAIQNLILSSLNTSPAGMRKFFILDGVRFNTSSIGSLKQLENSFAIQEIPRNPDQLTSLLEQIVSSFADTDEIIEQNDSLLEYNDGAEPSKRLAHTTVILFGWPNAFEGHDRELVQRIMTSYERYGVSIITVSYRNSEKNAEAENKEMPEYALQNAIHINLLQNESTIASADGYPQQFKWYSFNDELSKSYVDSLLSNKVGKKIIGNEYLKRYSLTEIPPYVREYKKIDLPFGIDGKDEVHSVSFENENFATYLVGASRSGKSTLLHTLIAGLIRNYHPDNVELWLADFKQLEFKRYINHLPPHVKYILLDESTELVFDLIDKLTAEMMERQKLFSRLGVERIDQIDTTLLEKPLPVIFVILDEFSIMSQSIADSPIYKLRLQNILAKCGALGIKFLFSSQTFTTGVAGLTATARAQIQQRIAMKGSKEEISETLELSSNLKTEQVRNWMDALPPHYALVKFRLGADTLPQVKRYLVMYFKDYKPRDQMIKQICDSMVVTEKYNPSDIRTYVDKHPVLVDGNTFCAFETNEFIAHVNEIKGKNINDLSGDEMFIAFGAPRLMEKIKLAALSSETRENILLISRAAEQACAASIILSSIKSFMCQGGQVQIWAYGKDRLFRAYRQVFIDNGIEIVEGIDSICDSIYALKQSFINKEVSNKLIVLIGMERICMDFDYVDGESTPENKSKKSGIEDIRKGFVESGAVVSSDEDEAKRRYALAWIKRKRMLKNEYAESGKTKEELDDLLLEEEQKFRSEYGIGAFATNTTVANSKSEDNVSSSFSGKEQVIHTPGAYKAAEDFTYVVKQGSRLGCHFLMNLSSFSDVKQCGLKRDYFRYRLAFQLSVEDSRAVFDKKIASSLPEHICQYDDTLERYSFRPFLHYGIGWEGWSVNESGSVVNPYENSNE